MFREMVLMLILGNPGISQVRKNTVIFINIFECEKVVKIVTRDHTVFLLTTLSSLLTAILKPVLKLKRVIVFNEQMCSVFVGALAYQSLLLWLRVSVGNTADVTCLSLPKVVINKVKKEKAHGTLFVSNVFVNIYINKHGQLCLFLFN